MPTPVHSLEGPATLEQKELGTDAGPTGEKADYCANCPALLGSRETNGEAAQAQLDAEHLVWWDEPADQDPENPMNWSPKVKWANILIISVISFLV